MQIFTLQNSAYLHLTAVLNASGELAQCCRDECSISAVAVRNLARNTQEMFMKTPPDLGSICESHVLSEIRGYCFILAIQLQAAVRSDAYFSDAYFSLDKYRPILLYAFICIYPKNTENPRATALGFSCVGVRRPRLIKHIAISAYSINLMRTISRNITFAAHQKTTNLPNC